MNDLFPSSIQAAHVARRAPRGTVYALVLMVSMLVTVIGISALAAVRVQLRAANLSSDIDDARLYAQSAVELTKQWIYADANWRTNRRSGAWATGMAIGGGTFSVSVTDPLDGDLSNSPMDPLVITATGYKGSARQQLSCTLSPAPAAYSCLQAGVIANGGVLVSGGRLTSTGLVSTNGSITATGQLDANAEAVGSCSGAGYIGSKSSGVAAKVMPNPATVFDYYIANGTAINALDVSYVLLSPSSNPYGTPNPLGIYVINCGGKKLQLDHVRVVGTLVILDPKTDSEFWSPLNIAPAVPGYPALLIRGSGISLAFDSGTLNEGAGKNYNPPGTPYNGVSNATTSDSYPSVINGLIYVSGSAAFIKNGTLNGSLVLGGGLGTDDNPIINWDSGQMNNPPPGFFDPPPMKVVSSTWAQSVN
ncbi:hypothetical protein BH09PLA1_BH09PLA1_08110 [soil metagenome]